MPMFKNYQPHSFGVICSKKKKWNKKIPIVVYKVVSNLPSWFIIEYTRTSANEIKD